MVEKNIIKKSAMVPTILVAGGAGFVGASLVESFLKKGSRVIVLDSASDDKKRRINHLLSNPKFAFFDVDISKTLPKEVDTVDYVLNLYGLEEYSPDEGAPLGSLLTSSLGMKNLLDLANKSKAKFLLVSTIDVSEGVASQKDLSSYFGYTKLEEKKYKVAEAKRFAEALVWEYYDKHDTDVRIVRLPEVYGPKMDKDACGMLGSFVTDLLNGNDLTVYGDENREEYYLYIDDAVSGLIKSLFGDNTRGNIYSLIGDLGRKVLSTAFFFRKLADGKIEVKFDSSDKTPLIKTEPPDTSNLQSLNWKPIISFETGIIKTLESFGYSPNSETFKPAKLVDKSKVEKKEKVTSLVDRKETPDIVSIKSPDSKKKKFLFGVTKKISLPSLKISGLPRIKYKRVFLFVLLLIFLIVPTTIAPIYSASSHAKKGTDSLKNAYNSMSALEIESSTSHASKALEHFEIVKEQLGNIRWAFSVAGKIDIYYTYSKMASSASYFSRFVRDASSAAIPIIEVWSSLRPDSETYLDKKVFDESYLKLGSAKNYLQMAQADYKYVDKEMLPEKVRSIVDLYAEYLNSFSLVLEKFQQFNTELPTLFGSDENKKYLVLFQNSNEIRPTGGFIGSYAILEVEKGKIKNLLIDDIYNPDGQIDVRNIKVAPPEPIADLLAEDRLYLRNSNWDPAFPVAAEKFEDIYFKITGETFDGVVATDLYFVQNLLKLIGPVYLASYDEEITAENLYERSQFHSDFNYVEGSSQKKAFLTVLGSKLVERLLALPQDKLAPLMGVVGKSLEEKHLLLSFPDSNISEVLTEEGWDGGLVEVDGDYLYVVNANLGGTKANYFVKNRYLYSVYSKTRDGLLRSELTLNYEHTGQDNSWPGGPYVNYFRVLTPVNTKLTGASIVGEEEEIDIFSEIKTVVRGAYKVYGYSFELQPSSLISIKLEYDLPSELSITRDSSDYLFYWQKQPGTHDDDYSFEFFPPFGIEADSDTRFSGKLNTDKHFFIKMR